MTSCIPDGGHELYQAEKCCHLVSAHAASARHICSSVRQFLNHTTFVHVETFGVNVELLKQNYCIQDHCDAIALSRHYTVHVHR